MLPRLGVVMTLTLTSTLLVTGCKATPESADERTIDGVETDFALKGGGGGSITSSLPSGVKSYASGNATDATATPQGGLLLVGGGTDRDDAMQWFVDRASRGDILILRTSGADGYNQWLLDKGADSVESLVFSKRTAASDPGIIDRIRKAEGIFFAGGDQSTYLAMWKDTPVETEVNAAVSRGAVVGGTSAGLAILGQFVYSAERQSLTSTSALADCFARDITLAKDFLAMPNLQSLLTDSHFGARDRMGRWLVLMARLQKDGWASAVRGAAVDEETAIAIDQAGVGTLFADAGHAYLASNAVGPEVCKAGAAVTYRNVAIYRLGAGNTFDFKTWTGSGGTSYSLDVNAGVVTSSSGTVY